MSNTHFVKKLNFTQHRRLVIRQSGNQLILTPKPEFKEQLQKIWKHLPSFDGAKTDVELKNTTQQAGHKKLLKN